MTTETPLTKSIATALPPNTVREKCQAKYTFTVEEIGELGRSLQSARRDYQRIDEELDSIKAQYKAKLTAAELAQDEFGRKLDDGFEMREAFAIVTFNDPKKGRKTYRHEDTGEYIHEEAMNYEDWQLPIFRDPDGKDAMVPPGPTGVHIGEGEPRTAAEVEEFLNTHDGEGRQEDLGNIKDVPNAGKTPLAAALDSAAVNTEQPPFLLPGFGLDDWNPGGLIKAFRLGAKKAGWSEAAISAMRAQLFAIDNIPAMKALLRPFVIDDAPSFEDLMKDAKSDFGDGISMRSIFAQIIAHYPSKYPGGNSQQNFNKFEDDVKAEKDEDDIAKNRTAESAE